MPISSDDFEPEMQEITPEEAEEVAFLICMPLGTETPWDDNEEATCGHCGVAVIYRPYAPKKPVKICIDCAFTMMQSTRQ